jgi:eukaryotic-like serine/threonine-protein kinase
MSVSFAPGDLVEHYRIDSLLSTGTLSRLYRATDTRSGKSVAVKVLEAEPPFWGFFDNAIRSEIKIGRKLNHPGIARVLSSESAGRRYAVIEWADGISLREMLRRRGILSIEQSLTIAIHVCAALEYVHSQGIAHLDLKPENVIVASDNQIKLIDFGIARDLRRGWPALLRAKSPGTPDYASPEQLRGKWGDERSDIYSLGLILYEMLTGEIPFAGANAALAVELRSAIEPERPSEINPEIPESLDDLICRAIAPASVKRQASATQFAAELQGVERTLECDLVESV